MKSILSKLFAVVVSVSVAALVFTACVKENETTPSVPPFIPTEPMPEIVDLGLPSGTLWSSFNLGASATDEVGKYYAWGETEAKSEYTLENYLFRESGTTADDVKFTKYVFVGKDEKDRGTVDGKKLLDASDDAAHVHLGGNWHMPSKDQINELFAYCEIQEEIVNGQKGVLATSKVKGYQDKVIFLPLTGYYEGNDLKSQNCNVLLSCNLDGAYPIRVPYAICYDHFAITNIAQSRWFGFPVRPVYYVPLESLKMNSATVSLSVGAEPMKMGFAKIPADATISRFTWTSSDENIATVDEFGRVKAVSIGKATITVATSDGEISASCEVNVPYPVPAAIDLGLPSGTLWSNFNLGATGYAKNGKLYAWGETSPKEDYSWENYIFRSSGTTDTDVAFTKYVTVEGRGELDGKKVLDPEDDAANVLLGGGWRMPTKEQCIELNANCNKSVETINGVKGVKFTSKMDGFTEKFIFIPFDGYANNANRYSGSSFYLWINQLGDGSPAFANDFYYSTGFNLGSHARNSGRTIRPVSFIPLQSLSLSQPPALRVGESAQLKMTKVPANASCRAYTWASSDETVVKVDDDGKVTAVLPGKATITGTAKDGSGLSASCEVNVPYPVPEMVDMGFPSGTRWATFNLGASKPAEKGTYFAWGELQGKKVSDYAWSVYRFWIEGDNVGNVKLSKYVLDEMYGEVDGKKDLDLEDDAAFTCLGGHWRIPTVDQVTELWNNCNRVEAMEDGIAGWRFTSKIEGFDSASIFIPRTGFLHNSGLREPKNIYFATSSMRDTSPYASVFDSSAAKGLNTYARLLGFPIRPVYVEFVK